MKLEETCPCGGSLKIDFDPGVTYGSGARLAQEARREIDYFHRVHRQCTKTSRPREEQPKDEGS